MISPSQLLSVGAFLASAANAYSSGMKPYQQTALDMFNVLKHQGGQGPWSPHTGYGINRDPPAECKVDQVQLFARHGERYPDAFTESNINKILNQFKQKNLTAINDLYWYNSYTSPALNPAFVELESFQGPYSGDSNMFDFGGDVRSRYGHLHQDNVTLPIFTASQERIVLTAVNVARGFFGANWAKFSQFVVLNETSKVGLNSLTPVNGCPAFDSDFKEDYQTKWANIGLDRAAKRFQKNMPGANVTGSDIATLMEMCLYDLNVKGSSPWCDYFTADDWVAFDYVHELDYYYYCGNGNPSVPAVGGVVANAAIKILQSPASPSAGNALYLSFMHEVNILMILTALGFVNPARDLDFKQPDFTNRWKTSQLVPMGTRFAIERLSCTNATDPKVSEEFVRLVVNDAVIPHDTCTSGPGFSCPIDEFVNLSNTRIPDPISKCAINSTYTAAKNLTFYWDWKNKTQTEYKNWVIDLSTL